MNGGRRVELSIRVRSAARRGAEFPLELFDPPSELVPPRVWLREGYLQASELCLEEADEHLADARELERRIGRLRWLPWRRAERAELERRFDRHIAAGRAWTESSRKALEGARAVL